MNFPIPIRHEATGREDHFHDKQAVADFLAGKDRAEFTGWAHLGDLPAPTGSEQAEAAAPASAPAPAAKPSKAKRVIAAAKRIVKKATGRKAARK